MSLNETPGSPCLLITLAPHEQHFHQEIDFHTFVASGLYPVVGAPQENIQVVRPAMPSRLGGPGCPRSAEGVCTVWMPAS